MNATSTSLRFSKIRRASILLLLSLAWKVLLPSLHADVISKWNQTARDYLQPNVSEFALSRGLAMLHVAQFDAVNAVVGGYFPYALAVTAPSASPEAAAAQAAYTILTNISRANISTLNNALSHSLAQVPAGQAKDDGIALGRLAAETIIRLRAADNPELTITAATSTTLGKWRTTPPNFTAGYGAQFRYFHPWTLRSAAQFRPGPPPALNTEQYTTDWKETRSLGARNSTERTADQTDAGRFHSGDEQTYLKPALAQKPLSLIESARLTALVYMVSEDVGIAFLEAQYTYSFWRPITAIRLAENDGNDATTSDSSWTPLLDTPAHPEYPSGTCTFTSALARLLISVVGDDFSFEAISPNTTKPRTFTRLSAAVDDAVLGRIAAGAHFRTSCLVGVELGKKIAQHALENCLRPLPLLTGARQSPGEFLLHLQPGLATSYVIEASADLSQWQPQRTNLLEAILHSDISGAADRRFYRVFVQP